MNQPQTLAYTNQQVAQILKDIATAYTIKKKNIFRINAYQEAAKNIITNPKPIYLIWQKDSKLLDNIPGIGPAILKKLDYTFKNNKLPESILKAKRGIPQATFYFTKINEIGPKTAYKLTKRFKFPKDENKAIKKLILYCQQGKIRSLKNFGRKSEQFILKNASDYLKKKNRIPLKLAQTITNDLIVYLHKKFPKTDIIPLGSLRRQTNTVGDIDLAAKSNRTKPILDHFVKYPKKVNTIIRGNKKASIKLKNNLRVDLMVQPAKTFGSLMQHFTGSQQHNIKLRQFALSKNLSLSEYGIKNKSTGKIYTFKTEKGFYNFLGLKLIPPQQRTGNREIKKYLK